MQLLYALIMVVLCLPLTSHAESWGQDSIEVTMGTQVPGTAGLELRPNAQGQVLIKLPADGMSLEENFRVSLHYAGDKPSAIYVIWRNDSEDKLHQRGVAPRSPTNTMFDMSGIAGWQGEARSLEIGLMLQSGQAIRLEEVSLDSPGLTDAIEEAWSSWTAAENWQGYSINVHTGTRSFRGDPYPVAVTAALGFALLLLYLLLMRARARYRDIAVMLFCLWLALDGLWQWDLWRQVSNTLDQYWGLNHREKLMASEDAVFAQLGEQVRELVPDNDARVFVASSSDPWGMLSAYYIAPLNTYWHRNGPELPDPAYLQSGDYILLLAASGLRYQPGQNHLELGPGRRVTVEQKLSHRAGYLLEVR